MACSLFDRRKFIHTTDSKHTMAVSSNVLNRQFAQALPNEIWVCDITYIRTRSSWLYLAAVLDLHSRKIVGWAMTTAMPAALVFAALLFPYNTSIVEMLRQPIESAVLTNLFSGQLPIPTRVAEKFLDFVGKRYDGSLDPDHVFIMKEKPRNDTELAELLARISQKKPASTVTLVASRLNESYEAVPFKSKHGLIYFDGQYAPVVINSDKKTEPVIRENNSWKLIDSGPSDNLLSTHPLLTKLDVLQTVSRSNFPIEITWEHVKNESKAKRIDEAHVLQLINSAPSIYKSV